MEQSMRLVSYGPKGCEQPGVLTDDDEVLGLSPLTEKLSLRGIGMPGILAVLELARPYIEDLLQDRSAPRIPVETVRLGPPVPHPSNVIAVGGTYPEHMTEMADVIGGSGAPPLRPMLTPKPSSTVIGCRDDLICPPACQQLDYGVELGVIIGRPAYNITPDVAMNVIAGYVALQDVTAWDLAIRAGEPAAYLSAGHGKGWPGFTPCGPWIVTSDEIEEPQRLRIRSLVNGVGRQDGSTSGMSPLIADVVAEASKVIPLRPGDLLSTGTPIGTGGTYSPPAFLKPGDLLETDCGELGRMANLVTAAG
jgi:2,4-didehydro-3-deoxy-L-rhamnonate hydrolase